jgi:ferredoxin-NADP reductase
VQTARFAALRAARARAEHRSALHWNRALKGLAEQVRTEPDLRPEHEELLAAAGFPDGVPPGATLAAARTPTSYAEWSLMSRREVSKHSAVYRFECRDRSRGTPHPRGGGRRPEPCTWHTTLLAAVGANDEGPLPWIEREYTPVSTAKEWEQGKVNILIKIYPRGAATSWLHKDEPGKVRLSKPVRTLSVPGLVPHGRGAPKPKSVLLLLAGTGCVALPQVLAHRDPLYKLGLSVPRRQQLHVPIDAVLSFRADDVLLVDEVAERCRQHLRDARKGLRRATLLLTSPNEGPAPFPKCTRGTAALAEAALREVENASVQRSRLSAAIVAEAIERMPKPCRVVVSGPSGFNSAAREMLSRVVDQDSVTVLSA